MNARYSREEGTKSPVYTKGICQKKWFSFFPCLLTMVEQLTQQGLALNLIEYKWLLPLDKMHALILCIPALSEFSAGAEGWAFMQHAANLCKFPLSVLNCLFQVKNLLNPQMWSAARWIRRDSHLKRDYQVTSPDIVLSFQLSSQHSRQGHPFGSVWNQLSQVVMLFRNFPQTGLSHQRPSMHQSSNALLSLSFGKVHEISLQRRRR